MRKLSSYIISSDRPRGLDALGRTNLRTNVTIVAKKKEIFSYEYVNIVAAIEDQNFEEIRNFVGVRILYKLLRFPIIVHRIYIEFRAFYLKQKKDSIYT